MLCERCKWERASGLWRLTLKLGAKVEMKLCAGCGFAAHSWRRFGVFKRKDAVGRSHEHPYMREYVERADLVRSLTE
jgi:hypothetical protein